jgi:16S rRNA (guanine527-N7)-methyltransferase
LRRDRRLTPSAAVTVPSLRARLVDVLHELKLDLSDSQVDALLAYLSLLVRWNATYNLTAVRQPAEMLTQHLADCLAMVRPLQTHLARASGARVLDVGSGAGLPGIVIALTSPRSGVTCVDKVGKKVAFLRHVIGELGLANVQAEHTRVETLKGGLFDVITSRAFSALDAMVTLTGQHLAPSGVWLAMKGKEPLEELLNLPADVHVFHVERVHVPGLNAQRCLVWMRLRQSG